MVVVRRNLYIYNLIAYLILSLLFLHVSFSLDADISALNWQQLTLLITKMPAVVAVMGIAAISVFYIKRISFYLVGLFSFLVFYKTFSIFLLSYSKLLLLLNVVYILISYNMILLLKDELDQALYNPGFDKSSLDIKSYCPLEAEVLSNGKSYKGVVTNLDEKSLVVSLDENRKIVGSVDVKIVMDGREFRNAGVVATRYDKGIGVRMSKNSHDELNWQQLYNILYKRNTLSRL